MKILFINLQFDDWIRAINNTSVPNITLTYIHAATYVNHKYDIVVTPYDIENIVPNALILKNNLQPFANKHNFSRHMKQLGLQHFIPKDFVSIDTATFPCIIKKPDSLGGNGTYICYSRNDYVADPSSQIQEYIRHCNEYSAHGFLLKGQLKWVVYYKIQHDDVDYIQCGKMIGYEKVMDINYKDVIEKIMCGFTGFMCMDFKILSNGSLKIFEINPRLGGSLVCGNDFRHLLEFLRDSI